MYHLVFQATTYTQSFDNLDVIHVGNKINVTEYV
jgi:hypothetical protein